jgi:hypothetical protein
MVVNDEKSGSGKMGRKQRAMMANEDQSAEATPPPGPENDNPAKPEIAPAKAKDPAWAKDLRSLYDSVVEEPLPDSFMDLLSKLDGDSE